MTPDISHDNEPAPFPDPEDATERVEALVSDDQLLRAVLPAGADGIYWYYICVIESHYQGNTYLNERYAQLAQPDTGDREDTFKTNGINRRADSIAEMATNLSMLYRSVEEAERCTAEEIEEHGYPPLFYDAQEQTDDSDIFPVDTEG